MAGGQRHLTQDQTSAPRFPRYSHMQGPAAGNSVVHDEAARRQNAPGGPVPYYPVGTWDTRRPMNTTFAPDNCANDQLWARMRGPWVYQGTEISGRDSGLVDPMLDGPARPSIRVSTRSYRREQGTDATRNYDPRRAGYRMYGWQDGSNTRFWGGTPGYYLPYAQRGSGDAIPSDTSGNTVITAGVPHGLHTHTVFSRRMTFRTYASTPQMTGPRQDRLSNSPRAGQSYSQTTVVQGGRRRS